MLQQHVWQLTDHNCCKAFSTNSTVKVLLCVKTIRVRLSKAQWR